MLEHGGQLRQATAHYDIPLADWLDLSTGINPDPWPVPALPGDVWQRLPEAGDGLEAAAAAYYGNANLLSVAGSQAAIQRLPTLLPRAVVACISPLYSEHPQAWQQAGHKLRFLQNALLPRALAAMTPYVLLCNPNNPTADRHPRAAVIEAAQQLKKRGGWLIVDEAFIDATPADSVAALARPALQDSAWQESTRARLQTAGERLHALLAPLGEVKSTALFATLTTPQANELHEALARQGILTRRFDQQPLLRFGLPGSEAGWQRLSNALEAGRKI